MPEQYPDDAALLSLTQDATTGVEYIPTGRSPYHLEFRKLVQRLLLASERANDLRIYQDGLLSFGVRGGRCFIGSQSTVVASITNQSVVTDSTTYVWIDIAGALQTSTVALPTDRTTFIPLAQITTNASSITVITDLRGEALLAVPDLASIGLTVSAATINTALNGAAGSVTAGALSTLTAGVTSAADALHTHTVSTQNDDAEVAFGVQNLNAGSSANAALVLSLPAILANETSLILDRTNGFIRQRYNTSTYHLVGTVHAQLTHESDLTASLTGKLVGTAPIDGEISGVYLSTGNNLITDVTADNIEIIAKINGVNITSTHPKITVAAGSGFRSTAQSDGTNGVVSNSTVLRGDVLTVDINRTVAGSLTNNASNLVVLIVIRAQQPE